ncbi:GNAT family N-acetyltransferase [Thalassobaculum sp. OXR-137]|uniref:GNAT family N-acetyltransferase n=1 Tax=Thalassobaculum sp. OXR-137 TaxID=3100173 RepID=UPI002AC9CF8A|nr:GNAT family N-acetyltransferase [Thalassobaculum sp. OXR-137]WPZ34746.1 GNAT family N-acetyltransferase [Thalassobaculum sp. OXR-137]
MSYLDLTLRPATSDDARALVEIVEMASEGLVTHIWRGMAEPGESPRDVGLRRARRGDGAFSHVNATLATLAGTVQGGLIGYPIGAAQPIGSDMPPLFVPLQELENRVPGSWYVNVLAVMPDRRGQGIGSRLLVEAERQARDCGCTRMSIIVSSANAGARRVYERFGFVFDAERRMGESAWKNPGTHWQLLVKPLA